MRGAMPETPVERPLVCRGARPMGPDRAAMMEVARARRDANRARRRERNRALVLAYSMLGHTAKQIAAESGLGVATVRDIQLRLRQEKKLDVVVAMIEQQAVPLAVEGLIEALHAGEKWAIQDTLKGRGYLVTSGANGAIQSGPPPPLTVNIMLAPGVPQDDPRLKPVPGNIVGVPRLSSAQADDEDKA